MNLKKTVQTGGKTPAFGRLHPAVQFIYLAGVLLMTMLTLNPWLLGSSFLMSLLLGAVYGGIQNLRRSLAVEIPVFLFTVLIQPVFSHSGETPLYYVNENAVTAEAYIYGLMIAVLLISVIQWCACAHSLITSDKWMYLFGRIMPSLGLVFSMVLRFVPLMRSRYRQIHEGQMGLGRTGLGRGPAGRLRLYLKELSILISWSLEASIETGASMEARGYGLKGRTSYHLYRWGRPDTVAACLMLLLFGTVLAGVWTGGLQVYYLPRICFTGNTGMTAACTVLFTVGAGVPLFYEMRGAIRWRCLNAKI